MRNIIFAVLAASLCGCTFVYIEGNHNSVSDTGGHGGVTLPEHTTTNPIQRFIPPQH